MSSGDTINLDMQVKNISLVLLKSRVMAGLFFSPTVVALGLGRFM